MVVNELKEEKRQLLRRIKTAAGRQKIVYSLLLIVGHHVWVKRLARRRSALRNTRARARTTGTYHTRRRRQPLASSEEGERGGGNPNRNLGWISNERSVLYLYRLDCKALPAVSSREQLTVSTWRGGPITQYSFDTLLLGS